MILIRIFICTRYHTYCVGMDEIPSGTWHCPECTVCVSCKAKDPMGLAGTLHKWVLEYKTNHLGNKVYSHTMCATCHR